MKVSVIEFAVIVVLLVLIILILTTVNYGTQSIATIFSGVAPATLAVGLFILQRYLTEKDVWGSRRDAWLKSHYLELAETMEDPFGEVEATRGAIDAYSYFNPRKSVLICFTPNMASSTVRIKENGKDRNYLKTEELRYHLFFGYRHLYEIINTTLNDTRKYSEISNSLIEKVQDTISVVFGKYVPGLEKLTNFKAGERGYLTVPMTNYILQRIQDILENRADMKFEPSNVTTTETAITYNTKPVALIPGLFKESVELCKDLNGIAEIFLQEAKELKDTKDYVSRLWLAIDSEIELIKNALKKSGVPVKGHCDTCKRTNDAPELIPYN